MKDRTPKAYASGAYDAASSNYAKNRLLFDWLCDDAQRAAFYAGETRKIIEVPSRVEEDVDDSVQALQRPRPDPVPRRTHLVLDRDLIVEALDNHNGQFSNLPYARIGSGSFMLALDPPGRAFHAAQQQAARRAFHQDDLQHLCKWAVKQAAPVALRADAFDLADFALQAALRFCSMYFGYALKDFLLLERAALAAHASLAHTILARHFVSDPLVLPAAQQSMGALLQRTAELMDAYALWDGDGAPDEGIQVPERPSFRPVMQRLASDAAGTLSGEQLATLVVGALAGTVGNIQAASSIGVNAMLDGPPLPRAGSPEWTERLYDAWHANPPVPFVPRRVLVAPGGNWPGVVAGDELILAIGAATRLSRKPNQTTLDPLVFGTGQPHACLGQHLALPLVKQLVEQVLALPSLARRFDPLDGTPMPLKKKWAFQCTSLPLDHRRVRRMLQQPLNVAMRVKSPVAEHAAKLREVIRGAAPRIEQALMESRHVHFAWFEFTDQDNTLVLHTVYDGDFDAYIDHFALAVGDLFDLLFKHVEPAPPTPVSKYPFEFVDMIRRFNRPPAAGYFFSAYPDLGAATRLRLKGRPDAAR